MLSACGGGGDDESAEPSEIDTEADLSGQTIVVSNWDGYIPGNIGEIVRDETGATVEVTNHASNEELVVKGPGSGGEGLDVIFGSQPYLEAFAEEELLEPIDPQYLENWDNLDPKAQELAEVDGQTYFAPYTWGTTGICYIEDLVDEPRRAGWPCSSRRTSTGQGHHDGHRALGRPACPEGPGLLGEHDRRGRDGRGLGPHSQGQAEPPGLRRHHVLRAAGQR